MPDAVAKAIDAIKEVALRQQPPPPAAEGEKGPRKSLPKALQAPLAALAPLFIREEATAGRVSTQPCVPFERHAQAGRAWGSGVRGCGGDDAHGPPPASAPAAPADGHQPHPGRPGLLPAPLHHQVQPEPAAAHRGQGERPRRCMGAAPCGQPGCLPACLCLPCLLLTLAPPLAFPACACLQPPGEKKAKAAAQAMSTEALKHLIGSRVQAKPANSDDDFVSQPPPASTSPPTQVRRVGSRVACLPCTVQQPWSGGGCPTPNLPASLLRGAGGGCSHPAGGG